MILGTGIDICQISRIERTVNRHGQRFLHKVFTPEERQRVLQKPAKIITRYAQLYAVKEACVKALGTGIRYGVSWQDIQLQSYETGQPYLILSGIAQQRLHQLTPPDFQAYVDVTITDDAYNAHAMVILSAVPQNYPPRQQGIPMA